MRKIIFLWLLSATILLTFILCAKQEEKPQPKTYYMVDTTKCIGCGVCVDSCRFKAISLDTISWKARIDTTHCTACGVCKRVCRYQAIKDTTY